MLKTMHHFAKDENANLAVDWVVLLAGSVSLALAFTIANLHNTGPNTQQATLENIETASLHLETSN
jgi:hypothetical protein